MFLDWKGAYPNSAHACLKIHAHHTPRPKTPIDFGEPPFPRCAGRPFLPNILFSPLGLSDYATSFTCTRHSLHRVLSAPAVSSDWTSA